MSDEQNQGQPSQEVTQEDIYAGLRNFLVAKGYVNSEQVDVEKTGQSWPTAAESAYKAYVTTKAGIPHPLIPQRLEDVPEVIASDEDFELGGAIIRVDYSKFSDEAAAENEATKQRLAQEEADAAEAKRVAEAEAAEQAAAAAEAERLAAEQSSAEDSETAEEEVTDDDAEAEADAEETASDAVPDEGSDDEEGVE